MVVVSFNALNIIPLTTIYLQFNDAISSIDYYNVDN